MPALDELASIESIKNEYEKSLLLHIFKKKCVRMDRDTAYRQKNRTLFRQTHNPSMTSQLIVNKALGFDLNEEQSGLMAQWFSAYFTKSPTRKTIPLSVKIELYNRQGGKCMACGEPLGSDWSKIHVDHIIPWKLVGDELPDNYQDLCDTCNLCKSSQVDYLFRSMINLS